jgi:flagellar biosynthesis anti-sigma factor FlgM
MNNLESDIKIARRNAIAGSAKSEKIPATDTGKSSLKKADRVTLSESSKAQTSISKVKTPVSDIRLELVNKFRNVLQSGSYEVKADEIADKIVQKIRENKNHLAL